MINKYNLTNSMLGKIYPFFLSNNSKIRENFYLYQITSPGLSSSYIPYISLKKVGERSEDPKFPYLGKDSDIISICRGGNNNKSRMEDIEKDNFKFISNILKKDEPLIDRNGDDYFPLIEMENGNNIQKSLIINLREMLRWKTYKFNPGNYVDILWTPDKFMLYKFSESEDNKYLEMCPVGLYSNLDPAMTEPINSDDIISAPKYRWSLENNPKKYNEINYTIKKLEWESFTRRIK